MVFHNIWNAFYGWAGACGSGIFHSHADLAFRAQAAFTGRAAGAVSGSGKFSADVHHAVGLHGIFAVADYLGRQSDRRDSLVHSPHGRRVGPRGVAVDNSMLLVSIFFSAFPLFTPK